MLPENISTFCSKQTLKIAWSAFEVCLSGFAVQEVKRNVRGKGYVRGWLGPTLLGLSQLEDFRVSLISLLQVDCSSANGWVRYLDLHFMYLLATSLSVIYASLDYLFGILCTTDQANVCLCFFFCKSLSSYIRILSLFIIYEAYFVLSVALEQALRGAPSNYVSGIWILLSCQISANQRECKQTLKNTCQR